MTPSAQTAGGRRVRRWTRELIIEKILEWETRYGEPPGSADWNPSLARWRAQEWRAERYREGVWPSTNAAKRQFGGSFDAAVRAAGLEPHRPGPRRAPGAAKPAVEPRRPETWPDATSNGGVARRRPGAWPRARPAGGRGGRQFGGSLDSAARAAGLAPPRPGPRRAPGAAKPAVEPRRPESWPDATSNGDVARRRPESWPRAAPNGDTERRHPESRPDASA